MVDVCHVHIVQVYRGVGNFLFLGLGGGANKVKTKELQFGSRKRYAPSHKKFLQNPRGVREQIRVICTTQG